MHTLVITGGTSAFSFAKQYVDNHIWDRILCADAGMEFCRKAGIRPHLILGDFDSAKPDTLDYYRKLCPENMEQFPAEKDGQTQSLPFCGPFPAVRTALPSSVPPEQGWIMCWEIFSC